MLYRRQFVYGLLGLAASWPVRGFSQTEERRFDEIPPLPSSMQGSAAIDPRNDESSESFGLDDASSEQRRVARQILRKSPTATTPYDVAKYFEEVGKGLHGEEIRGYMRAWPRNEPANPVIVSFFSATNFSPSGDQTAWCAAFMNWCIRRSQEGRPDISRLFRPTNSASSGSFRQWANPVRFRNDGSWSGERRTGDLIVFQKINNDGRADPRQGHVGFYVDEDDKYVYVLGGNQFEGRPVVHCVNTKRLRKLSLSQASEIKIRNVQNGLKGGVLAIHSVRTAKSLHSKNLNT
ncbi:MAG: hypothetical protein K0R64_3213 [Novosphingobium lindaniclasticum]|nr:hypothetical protein [Novosphingobium lindaniclasticum]